MKSKLIVIAAVALAVGGCNRPDPDRGAPDGTTSLQPLMGSVEVTPQLTPPAAPERSPVPPDANAAAPGTSASRAFANNAAEESVKLPPSEDKSPEAQHLAVAAQEAAAKAPDTAAADAAKRKAYEGYAGGGTPHDPLASAPIGTPTSREESSEMPLAGQANDHSSTALDKASTISMPNS